MEPTLTRSRADARAPGLGAAWAAFAVGLLVQAGLIGTPGGADHRALAWHAYLWDPWFLVWGVLVTAALFRSR